MTTTLTSVASAAVIGGDLIMGLSDGSIINCGRVQGPQGLTGPQGPMGATGRDGQDGNTIHTVEGAPDGSLGRDGDYAINVVVWEIYGPRSGGVWGTGTPLRGNARGGRSPETTQNLFGSNSPGSGGGGGGIQQINGGEGITTTKIGESVYVIDADVDQAKGLNFEGGKIAIKISDGLEFDAFTGELKTLSDSRLPYLIQTDKVLRSGEAAIELVDNDDNYSNVKFVGTNGVDVTSTASSIVIDGSKLSGDITAELTSFATIVYSDSKDQELQNQIDDLEVQKGAAANYDCKAVSGAYNARPGECDFNDALASNVTILGLGQEDKAGKLTKTINVGDIIEIVGTDGSDTRYKATDVTGAPLIVIAEFVSGEQTFVLEQQYTVFIYPQNEAAASKDYVDAQDALKLDKAGGTVTGPLTANGTVTITANSNYSGASPDEDSLVNRKYVDDKVNSGGDFLPLSGGRMLGNIEFEGSSQIKAKGTSSLDGRASLVISGNADKPVAVDSGSSYLPALSIFGYDAGQPNNRRQVIDLKANGQIQATGQVLSTEGFKSTSDGSIAFHAKPNDGTETCLIRSNGSAKFTNHLELLKANKFDHDGFVIYGTVSDGTEGKLLSSFHNTDPLPDAVNYQGKIEQPRNIVNKAYVDSIAAGPARLGWKWDSNATGNVGPAAGKFYFDDPYLRISFVTDNGVMLNDNLIGDTGSNTVSYGPMLTVWYLNSTNNKWRFMRAMRIESYRWNYNNHFEFEESSARGLTWSSLLNNTRYYLTAGGFF